MRLLLVIGGFSMAMAASGATHEYEVAMRVYADGKLISAPTITTTKGEETELVQVNSGLNQKLRLKLTADDKDHPNIGKGIQLKMTVDYELGKKENAKAYKHYESQPEILVQSGKEGSISVGGKTGGETLSIKVLAKRI